MKRHFKAAWILASMLALLGYSEAVKQPTMTSADALRQCLREYREEYGIPGIAAVVLTSESILAIGVDGLRKLGAPDSVRVDDRFHIGSNTKAITGFVAAVLVERGLIDWDSRIIDVFPEFAEAARDVYKDKTLKDLMSHRARIMPFTSGAEFAQLPEFQGDSVEQRNAFTGWLLQQEPVDIDTARGYTYSNAGYGIAAAMLQKVSGKSWEQLMQDELFRPLAISGTFGWPAYEDDNQPWGHYFDTDSDHVCPHDPHDEYQLPKICNAAGDISMSIRDYAKFLQINLIGLHGRDTIITATAYQFLHPCTDSSMQYAVGWGLREHEGYKVSRHNGSAGTFYCTALIFRGKDLALGVMMNGVTPEAEKAIAGLREKILEPYMK